MAAKDIISKQVDQAIGANSPATLMGIRGVVRFNDVPTWLIYLVIIAVVASWIPLVAAVRAKFVKNGNPRVHLFQDMDNQAKYKAQTLNPVFANEMSMRPRIPGTVARGNLDADDFLERGFKITGANAEGGYDATFYDGFPEQVEVTPEFVARGKELYARYCYLCHGFDGYGNGPVHVKASQNTAKNPKWVQPSNLHDEVRLSRTTGHLYNTVNIGIRNMSGYGQQIPAAEDRWAVVAYVKALQLSQNATADMLPAGVDPASVPVRPTLLSGNAQQLIVKSAEETENNPLGGTPDEAKTDDPDVAEELQN